MNTNAKGYAPQPTVLRRVIIALEFAGIELALLTFLGSSLLTRGIWLIPLIVLGLSLISLWSTIPAAVLGTVLITLSFWGRSNNAASVLMILFFSLVVATEVVFRVPKLARSSFITWSLTTPLIIVALLQIPVLETDVEANLARNRADSRGAIAEHGLTLPALRYETGQPIPLGSARDVFVLYFWTQNCAPCQKGLARLGPFASNVTPRNDIHVVAVPVEPGVSVPEWLPATVERAQNASRWFEASSDGAVPWTLFVSGGRICGSTVGYSPQMEARWASMIRSCRGNS